MEKFIRQLPLVIAIILMISNCESANDSIDVNGDGSSGSGSFSDSGDGSGGSGGGFGGGSDDGSNDGSGGGSTGGSTGGPNSNPSSSTTTPAQTPPVAACVSDPSDSVSVQMPQQVAGQWQMSNVSLSTLTKYQIYQKLSAYYQDSGKVTGAQAAQVMQMASMQQPGMFPGGGMMGMMGGGMMGSMAQMPQMAQMNQIQVQQYVQALMQQMQILQVQNQQLEMKVKAEQVSTTMSGDYGDFGSSDVEEDRDSSEKYGEKGHTTEEMHEKLEAIANMLGVPVTDDLAAIVEERLGSEKTEKSSEKGADETSKWEEKYQDLAGLVPTENGETAEQALRRLFPAQAKIHDDAVLVQSSKKENEEELEGEAGNEEEYYTFDPKTAPKSLTPAEEKQLETWKEERATLMDTAGCSLSEAVEQLTLPQQWALLKEAFARLHQHGECQQGPE